MESNTPCEPLNLVKHKTKPVAVVAPSAVVEAQSTFPEPSQGRLLKIPKAFSSVDSAKIGDPLRPDGLYSMIHSLVACEHKFLTTLYVNGLMNGSSRPPLGFPLLPGYSGSFLSDVYRGQFGVAPVLGNLLTFADTQRQLWQMVGSPENQSQSSAAQIPCASTSTDTELPPGKKSRGKRSSSMDQKNSTSSTTEGSKNQDSGQTGNNQDKKKPHIKKPLNAFMLYMKEMRAKVVAECTLKESAAINQILGRRWHALGREEQAKYYELARRERQLHMQLYPDWSSRANSSRGKKRKRKQETNDGGNSMKKCRARYGLDQQNQWCKPCRRKKKCIRYMEAGESMDECNQSEMGSCGSTGDANTPPDDDRESLPHSLSSPGGLSGLSSLTSPSMILPSPSTSLASPSVSLASPCMSLQSPMESGPLTPSGLSPHPHPLPPLPRLPVGTNPHDINNPLSVNQLTGQCIKTEPGVSENKDSSANNRTVISVT